jgi:hypothetical protein
VKELESGGVSEWRGVKEGEGGWRRGWVDEEGSVKESEWMIERVRE